jgi:urease accessory protein UreF
MSEEMDQHVGRLLRSECHGCLLGGSFRLSMQSLQVTLSEAVLAILRSACSTAAVACLRTMAREQARASAVMTRNCV